MKAPRLLSARLVTAAQSHPVISGQCAHPSSRAVEQRLAVIVREAGNKPSDRPECFTEAACRRHDFKQHPPAGELECDVDEFMLAGESNAIGAADAGRST